MPNEDLTELVAGKSEDLSIEYKAWIETGDARVQAKLARHFAALSNHGGGYLVIGVDDRSREPQGETQIARSFFSQDALAGIARKYLEPCPSLRVEEVERGGVRYPVVIVPPHQGRPVIAIKDGPQDEQGKRVGIAQGNIYIRAPGPESRAIRTADEWNGLLERCLAHRSDLLGNIIRQSLARSHFSQPDVGRYLRAAVEETRGDFIAQVGELVDAVDQKNKARVADVRNAHCSLGYAVVGDDGALVRLEDLRGLNRRVSMSMRNYAYDGWMSFVPLDAPGRSPQMRMGSLAGQECEYLEGMRLPQTTVLMGYLDYWRIYSSGVCCISESYMEDAVRASRGGHARLNVANTLFRLHSLLAHARLLGREVSGIERIVVRTEWTGLSGRNLEWNFDSHYALSDALASNDFTHTVSLTWAELRDTYYESLCRVVLPVLNFFPLTFSTTDMASKLTPETVSRLFSSFGETARLFED